MSDDPFAPFRSRRARVVTLTLGAVAVLVFAAVAVGLYVSSGRPDALLLVVFGLAVAAVCWRYASISAIPDREGILVRKLVHQGPGDFLGVLPCEFHWRPVHAEPRGNVKFPEHFVSSFNPVASAD